MKKRNAFTSKNTNGFTSDQIEAMCERYDLWAHENQFHGADFKGWQQRSEHAKAAIVRRASDIVRNLETQELPNPEQNGAQPVREHPKGIGELARGADSQGWPPADGVTGKSPVDPNTLEPLTPEAPAVD